MGHKLSVGDWLIAKPGRKINAIDGRALACVKHALGRHQVEPNWYVEHKILEVFEALSVEKTAQAEL